VQKTVSSVVGSTLFGSEATVKNPQRATVSTRERSQHWRVPETAFLAFFCSNELKIPHILSITTPENALQTISPDLFL